MEDHLSGSQQAMAADRIIYEKDPASSFLDPFRRSQDYSGYGPLDPEALAPKWALERADEIRNDLGSYLLESKAVNIQSAIRCTRALLVHVIASKAGWRFDGEIFHPDWWANGTETGRFGVSSFKRIRASRVRSISPHRIWEEDRCFVVPSAPDRQIAVLDFKAMDLGSMISMVPELLQRYQSLGPITDLHQRTAELLGENVTREQAKLELFRHAYGGKSELAQLFRDRIPELVWFSSEPAANAGRAVQTKSSEVFKSALSRALPLLTSLEAVPMFTVHDELVLDVEGGRNGAVWASEVAHEMERGAAELGSPCKVEVKIGSDYGAAKR